MEQLSAVGREIKVEALGLKIVTGTLVALHDTEVFRPPEQRGQLPEPDNVCTGYDEEPGSTHQIKLWCLLLPFAR